MMFKTVEMIEHKFQIGLNSLHSWFNNNGMVMNSTTNGRHFLSIF